MNLIPRDSLFDIDRFFDNNWPFGGGSQGLSNFTPRVDIRETDKVYEITAELPGVDKKDINISVENGVLRLEAESRQEDKEEKDGRVIRQERRYGKFIRSFDLGTQVHERDISASFDNGVLKLNAPKAEPKKPEAKRIEIA